jgi:hypothetical protein
VTVFNQDLVRQDSDLLGHRMTQIVWVQHPLEQFCLHAALPARLLQFGVEVQDVGLERLPFAAL